MEQPTPEQLRFVLESAILAPSADNHHRVRFTVSGDSIGVRLVDRRLPLEGGYKRVLLLLSLGALVENLTIAASRFAIATEALLLPDPAHPDVVLKIRLRPQAAEVDPLWSMIPLRHTNRALIFRGPAMSNEQRAELAVAVGTRPGNELIWLDETESRRQVLRLMRCAETERFRNPLLHEELFSAIRFDVGWQKSCTEGLPPGSLGVEAALRIFFAALRHWSLARLANIFGAHHLLGVRSCFLPCRLAPHLGLLATRRTDDQSVINAGRSFQRLWLVVTAHGRVLQPMPASALYAFPAASEEGIPAALQRHLVEGWKKVLGDSFPLMLFRLGSATQSPVVSGRRPLTDYLEGAWGV